MSVTDRNGAGRGVHLISLIASTVLHAALAAALVYAVINGDTIPPEPIAVELVSDDGTGPPGSDAAGGQPDSAPSAGVAPQETTQRPSVRPSVEAQASVQRSPRESTREPGLPLSRPHAVAKKPRSEPKKVPSTHQQTPALGAEPKIPAEDAVSPTDDGGRRGDPLVASLGSAGAAAAATMGRGSPGPRAGDNGSPRGPGFSLGSAANPMPSYPPAARRRGIEGTVVLDVLVSADGQALSVEVARSSGSSLLDEAARETIARWRFRPAMRREEAIEARATVPVQFSLVEP